ncbi:MAG: hypothetical protein KJ638_03420, partial [Chloroflexi bacterium]|nr:hypothetical protein [Chloroflexota bacterium]
LAPMLLSGCTGILSASALPTLLPTEYIPTVIALTAEAIIACAATPTHTLTDTPQATPTPRQTTSQTITAATATPSPTAAGANQPPSTSAPTPTHLPPIEIPYADIQIISPGALSRVVTPIKLHAFLIPGAGGRVRVELLGEDGHLLYRKIFVFDTPVDARVNLLVDLDFEISGVAETARLVVSIDDSYGRLKSLASENVILLSLGNPDINPPGDLLELIVIQQPTPKVLIQGGTLTVSGLVRSASEQPLLIELIATDGRIIGSRLAGIATSPEGGHRLFAAEVPYHVNSPTWVRLTVSERGTRLPGVTQLSSLEILLGP